MDWQLIQSFAIVLGFLLAIFLFSYYLKRNAVSRILTTLGTEFKIVSKIPLTNRTFLFIVQIGKHYLLLGVTENSVSAIADVTKIFQSTEIGRGGHKGSAINATPNQSSESIDFSFKNFLKETFKRSSN
ncbi:MAG: flagellar biosynthetic protein FliO [Candidatus Kapaibacteriota bacterium]